MYSLAYGICKITFTMYVVNYVLSVQLYAHDVSELNVYVAHWYLTYTDD